MAVGYTINHIAAIVIPVVGGGLWMVDYKIPFIAGACLSLVSLTFVQFMKTQRYCQINCVKFSSANFCKNGRLLATFPMDFDLQRSSIFKQTKVSKV